MAKHNELGKIGEEKAIAYLRQNGYTIKATNYRYLKAEIDIIAQIKNTLCIVEVKTRTSDDLQRIAETITPKKIKLLVAATDNYVQQKNLEVNVRFDIITVLVQGKKWTVEHLEDAFYHF